jgi:hypothetical protein
MLYTVFVIVDHVDKKIFEKQKKMVDKANFLCHNVKRKMKEASIINPNPTKEETT